MSEKTNPFSNLINGGNLFQEPPKLTPRKTAREVLNIDVMLVSPNGIVKAKIVDASPGVLRVDQAMPLSNQEPFTLVIKQANGPAIEAICYPIVAEQEFKNGNWSRLKMKSESLFSRIISAFKKAA